MFLFFLSFILASQISQAKTLSMTVGRVEDHIVTSREVEMQHLLGEALRPSKNRKLQLDSLDSKAFAKEVHQALLEAALFLEAKNFNVIALSSKELQKAASEAIAVLRSSEAWKSLDAEPGEWRGVLEKKLIAEKFIRFRKQSSLLPVTDAEAKRYFDQNRLKFGTLPFENFKENIKTYLSRSQVERRLRDWYEVIMAKYKTKNFLSEI